MMIDPARPILPDLPDGVEVTHDHLLDQQVRITQPKIGYRVGSDAVLAAASLTAGRGRVLDLGAGVGGISLCIARRLSGVHVTAVEIDPVAAALARYNVALNGLDQQVRVVDADITAMPAMLANAALLNRQQRQKNIQESQQGHNMFVCHCSLHLQLRYFRVKFCCMRTVT